MSKDIPSIDDEKNLIIYIENNLKPKVIEKKQLGEVFTPMELVNEMLDKLDYCYKEKYNHSIFSNKNLKWLDPANGMGNFPIAIYYRLLNGLQNEIKDEKERKKHILENMIYMSELNSKNCFICKEIFDIQNEYKLNLFKGNSLELNIENEWNIKEFDIIVGNPPYQTDGATGDNKLYLSFIKNSLDMLKDNGLLLFITPTNVKNYLTGDNKNRSYLKDFYNLLYLTLNTANKYFPSIGSTFSYFVIEKKIVKQSKTIVEYLRNNEIEKNIISIKENDKIPLCLSNEDLSILNKTSNLLKNQFDTFDIKKASYIINGKSNLQRIRKEHIIKKIVKNNSDDKFKFKIIDKITKTNPFPGLFYYYDKTFIDFGKPKIIMCSGGYLMPSLDINGEYNLSDNMIYLLIENQIEFEKFNILVESKLVNYLNKITMTDGLHGRDTVIMSLKKFNLNEIKSEYDIYKLYNLNENEINLIENY